MQPTRGACDEIIDVGGDHDQPRHPGDHHGRVDDDFIDPVFGGINIVAPHFLHRGMFLVKNRPFAGHLVVVVRALRGGVARVQARCDPTNSVQSEGLTDFLRARWPDAGKI